MVPNILQIGSSTNRVLIPDKIAKQGVIVADIKEAIVQQEDRIREILESNQLDYTEDKFLALEAARFSIRYFYLYSKKCNT